jgi:hypothetical protein
MRAYFWIALAAASLASPAAAQQQKLQAMDCINTEPAGEDLRINNRCPAPVNVSYCVQGNPRSAWRCPKGGADRIHARGFTTAKRAAREGGQLVWGACFHPHTPAGFTGMGRFNCR